MANSGPKDRALPDHARVVDADSFVRRFVRGDLNGRIRGHLRARDNPNQQKRPALNLFDHICQVYGTSPPRHAKAVYARAGDTGKYVVSADRVVRALDDAIRMATSGRYRFREPEYVQRIAAGNAPERILKDIPTNTELILGVLFDTEAQSLRFGILPYPPVVTLDAPSRPGGLLGSICVELLQELDIQCTCKRISLNNALQDIARAGSDTDALDVVFGVFETPHRNARDIGVFFSHLHLVSLVGVTAQTSRISSLNDVMTNADIEIYCANDEVGHEFATRVLCLKDRPPRLNVVTIEHIEDILKHIHDGPDNRVALLDGVSASSFISKHQSKGRRLDIRLRGLMWYPNGILVRRELASSCLDTWTPVIRRLRMAMWNSGHERRVLQPLIAADVIRPILTAV